MNKTFTWRLLTPGELTDVYLQEMRRDFPAGELKPLSMILTSEAEGLAHTWGVFDGETLAAYLLMVRPEGSAISQLDYFAVVPAYRAGGLGAKLLAALPEYEAGAQAIIIEAEMPEKAEDEAMAVRRLGFYARCGARDTGYYEHLFDAWFRILVLPCPGAPELSDKDALDALVSCYKRTISESQWRKYVQFYPPVLVCCAVCAVSAANFLTTPSVSLEGRTVWLLQSLPIPSWQALCAKLELHLLLTGVPAALCLVCMQAAVQMPPVYFCLTLLEAELFVLLSAEMGLALGLVLPNLHWTSEAAVIKMSGCTLLSMAANLVAVLVLTLAQTNLLKILPLPAVMAAALVLLAGADGLLGHWLKTRGARRLAELS